MTVRQAILKIEIDILIRYINYKGFVLSKPRQWLGLKTTIPLAY